MRWEGDRQSDNIEDRRGGGGGGGFGIGGGTVGIGTIVVALIGSWFFGVSPSTILSLLSGGSPAQVPQAPGNAVRAHRARLHRRHVVADLPRQRRDVFAAASRAVLGPHADRRLRRGPVRRRGAHTEPDTRAHDPAEHALYARGTHAREHEQRSEQRDSDDHG